VEFECFLVFGLAFLVVGVGRVRGVERWCRSEMYGGIVEVGGGMKEGEEKKAAADVFGFWSCFSSCRC